MCFLSEVKYIAVQHAGFLALTPALWAAVTANNALDSLTSVNEYVWAEFGVPVVTYNMSFWRRVFFAFSGE